MMKLNMLLIKTATLSALQSGLELIAETYHVLLFLSVYPAKNISYLYLMIGFSSMLIMQVIRRFMKEGLRRFTLKTNIVSILLLTIFAILIKLSTPGVYFIFPVILMAMNLLNNTNFGSIVCEAYSLREYKRVTHWFTMAASIGAIAMGILVPILLAFFEFVVLTYVYLGMLILATLAVYSTPVEEVPTEAAKPISNKQLLSSPLFIYCLLLVILVPGVATLVDFIFMNELAKYYSANRIGQILAPFYSSMDFIIMISALTGARWILKRFGVSGLMLVFPVGMFLPTFGFTLAPSLGLALTLSVLVYSLQYGFYGIGASSVTNVFPDNIRTHARYQLQSIGRNIGIMMTSVLLVLVSMIGGLRLVGGMILAFCLAIFFCSLQVKKHYRKNLQNAVNLHRFKIDYFSNARIDQVLASQMAENALKDKEADVQLFGFTLLDQLNSTLPTPALIPALLSESVPVRIAAIQHLRKYPDLQSLALLEQQLNREDNPEVIWHLIQASELKNKWDINEKVQAWDNSNNPSLGACAIYLKNTQGTANQIADSLKTLNQYIQSENSAYRVWAARLLEILSLGDVTANIRQLMQDQNAEVVNAAISASKFHSNPEIIVLLLEKLKDYRYYTEAKNSLLFLGSQIIELLHSRILAESNRRTISLMISLLSNIQEDAALEALMSLIKTANVIIRDLAIEQLAYRAIQNPLNDSTNKVVISHLEATVSDIQHLQSLSRKTKVAESKTEIGLSLRTYKKRFLYLLAAKTRTRTALDLMPTLLAIHRKASVYNRALELLEVSTGDKTVISYLPVVFENKKTELHFESHHPFQMDPWITDIRHFQKGHKTVLPVESINKILLLRKVKLFAELSPEILLNISESLTMKSVKTQEIIFSEGDTADGLYILAEGEIEIKKKNQALKQYHSTDFFGELALLDRTPRRGTAIATQNSLLYCLSTSEFERITEEVPEILKVIVKTVLEYIPH